MSDELRCKNYEFCKSIADNNNSNLCWRCGDWYKYGFGWNELEFRDAYLEEHCSICEEPRKRMMKFPADNCEHWFCIDCSKDILIWNGSRYSLNPVYFGAPNCPNECINPKIGFQCNCSEYQEVLEEWEQNQPEKYDKWLEAENEMMDEGIDPLYGSQRCPTCYKHYEKKV